MPPSICCEVICGNFKVIVMEEYEKIYFDEFQHSIIDLGEKVTITALSDKYERPISEISSALSKWIEIQKCKKLRTEHILRGNHKDGYPLITIVPEEKLQTARESLKNAFSFIYSAEISNSSPSLDLIQLSAVKKKNLILPEEVLQRKEELDARLGTVTSEVIRQETSAQSSKKESNDGFFKNQNYNKKSNSAVKVEYKSEDNHEIQESPKKTFDTKPEIKPAATKKVSPLKGKGNKGSIASFFSAKPSAAGKSEEKSGNGEETKFSKVNNDNEKKGNNNKKDVEVARPSKIKDDLKKVEEIPKKRPLEDSDTKDVGKITKKQKTVSAGRRRIIMESSDEENNEEESQSIQKSEDPVKIVTIADKEQSEQKEVGETNLEAPLTFQDEDGFLVTVKEKKSQPKKQEQPTVVKKNLTKLDKVPVKAATKQGSIRNFFIKK